MPLHPLIETATITAIVAICISSLSLIVAGTALTYAIKTYRRAGARPEVRVPGALPKRTIRKTLPGLWTRAEITNRGLAGVQYTKATWEVKGKKKHPFDGGTHAELDAHRINEYGEPLAAVAAFPANVGGNTGFTWMTAAPNWDPDVTGQKAYRMRIVVTLGSGDHIKSPWVIVAKADADDSRINRLRRRRRVIV